MMDMPVTSPAPERNSLSTQSTPSQRPFQHPDNPPDVTGPPPAPEPSTTTRPEPAPMTFQFGTSSAPEASPDAADRPGPAPATAGTNEFPRKA